MKYSALDIRSYKDDGAVKICQVTHGSNGRWHYEKINEEYMYAQHTSWVYFIVVGNTIFKLGETGSPLGIRVRNSTQPRTGTTCRMGRLATQPERLSNLRGSDTDAVIRSSLTEAVKENKVSIWARKCDIAKTKVLLAGNMVTLKTAFHKDLEKRYLDNIYDEVGHYPLLNKGRM